MRILDQARLGFQEGRSDKVYELDLVEVAANQYVVNFRFGRRGTALRDGTKTPVPISLDKARAVYTSLIAEKTRSGYQPLVGPQTVPPKQNARSNRDVSEREKRNARELIAALGMGHRSAVPLHLIVRKVGDRRLQQAEPLLLELLASGSRPNGMKPDVFRHFVIAALARCGSAGSLPRLRTIVDDTKAPRHVRDVARLALTMLGGSTECHLAHDAVAAPLQPDAGAELPSRLNAAERLLADHPAQAHAAVFGLYIGAPLVLGDSVPEAEQLARRIVLGVARVARLTGTELGLLRTLNWAAELRGDGELFALLTRRFESSLGKAEPTTMNYFRRRAARVLRRLGSIGSIDYVKMATELLLLYGEQDAEPARHSEFGIWDSFSRYHALNFVLYGGSTRYAAAGHRRATWRCQASFEPGQQAPARREESYPSLWDQAPESLWRLGVSNAASIIIHFAVQSLRGNSTYLAQVDDAALASALARAQRPMQLLAFEVTRKRPPNIVLARAALASGLDDADGWVLDWVEHTPALLREEMELLALLITARSPRVRQTVTRLASGFVIDPVAARDLVSRSIAILMQLTCASESNDCAVSVAAFLLSRVPEALESLGIAVLKDLLTHELSGVAELGGELVRLRARNLVLADDLLDTLLNSKHAAVRSLGARIVAETPPAVIKGEPELLAHLALANNAELRQGTRGLLTEVARLYPEVGRDIASRLIDALLTPQPAGVPAHIVSLLRHELRPNLPKRNTPSVLALVGALSPHAREAGGLLLTLLGPDDLELETIVRLSSHEIHLVRQGAWALARAAQERFLLVPIALARLCDARWADSRAFAFDFLRSFPPAALVPDVVIAICDSINPEVQRFGQTLLLQHWRDELASRYLIGLSEHPAANIQLLVSGLLARHASGNLEMLERLIPCFLTILSQVNRGGVAKQRVLDFLRTEAVSSVEAATLLAPLLERQSLTQAVSHKGPLIATLVELHDRYPEVAVPISSPAIPLQQSRSSRGI